MAGADVVLTSYTLFRLDFSEYTAAEWSALILDEAQFTKNHQSRVYQCARRLEVPFKLAIAGTPMENNLMELWSLLSISAPGLFANPTQFGDYYRKPIEKRGDAALLAQLRRRIKPLVLRRTEEQVATELPAKQEQVLEVELEPRHRKSYDTQLQRERQKVLGLIDDMNKNRFTIFRSLTLLRQLSLDATLNRPRFLAALLLAAPGGASDEVSPSGGCWSGACAELFKGDQAVAVRARAAGAEAGGEGVAVRAALLTEVAGVAVRAGVDGAGAPGSRWGWCSGRGGHWDGVAAPVGGLPAGLVAVCLPSPGGGQGCLAGQALSR